MTMIVSILISWAIKLFIDLPCILMGLFIVPIALLFRTSDDHLPKWAWLWDNGVHGTDGDSFWINRCGNTFWCRYQWLALRNPTFNLGRHVLSITTRQPYTLQGDQVVGDKKASGSYWLRSGWAWEYYSIGTPYQFAKTAAWAKRWPALQDWLTKRRAIRQRYGWKIHGSAVGDVCGFVCVCNPLMPYSGK